jgi:hypothetical protein
MRRRSILSWASVLLLTCGVASHARGEDSNTTPDRKGNTGWTGGAQDQPSQTGESGKTTGRNAQDTTARSPQDEAASKQPLTATGTDLNGPPRRFPPNKTPE